MCCSTISGTSAGGDADVPDRLGVDDDRRPLEAGAQAAGRGDGHPAPQLGVARPALPAARRRSRPNRERRRTACRPRGGRSRRRRSGARFGPWASVSVQSLAIRDVPARRTHLAGSGHPGRGLSGHHRGGRGARLLRLPLRRGGVGAQQGVADGGEPAAGQAAHRAGAGPHRQGRRRAVRRDRVDRHLGRSARPRRSARRAWRRWRCSTRRSRSVALPAPDAARRRRELDRWQSYVRGLEWKSLQPWTADQPGNFRHLHQLFEGKSVLIAYAAKKTDDGPQLLRRGEAGPGAHRQGVDPRRDGGGDRQAAGGDPRRGGARRSTASRSRATPFQYEASFGKTLYAWRIQITPAQRGRAARAGRDRAHAGRCCWCRCRR